MLAIFCHLRLKLSGKRSITSTDPVISCRKIEENKEREGLNMALVVNTNVPSVSTQRYLMESRKEMETAMERLSSGQRINSAADDAAGLAIATRMDSQVRGLNMAVRNANDGISIVQTAEGAMQEITEMLQRMRELAVQASSGANSAIDRASLDAEVQQLKAEINRISETTVFNGISLLDGTYDRDVQIGYNLGETLNINIGDVSTTAMGLGVGGTNGGGNTLVGGRVSLSTSTVINKGDIEINGVALDGFNGTSSAVANIVGTSHNIADFVDVVNRADAGVTASAYNRVVASVVGSGVVAANEFGIAVGAVGANPLVEQVIGASNSMSELVNNINLAMGGAVQASTDDSGRLVLSNTTGGSITVMDLSGTSGATDTGSGFEDDAGTITNIAGTATANVFNGFVRLSSDDGSDIEITRGNFGLTAPGSLTDLAAVGFREISEDPSGQPYTVTGLALTSSGIADAIGMGTGGAGADLTINGVEIYEETLSAASTSFQGKLDLINAFTTETGVVASAYYEETFDFANTTFVSGLTFDINGTEISMASTLAATVTNINNATSATGVTAIVNGNNVTLKGVNVQQVTIDNYAFDLDDTFEAQINAQNHSSLTAGTERTIDFTNIASQLATGLQLTLSFRSGAAIINTGGGTSAIFTGASADFTYTVQAGDTTEEVAQGLRDLIWQELLNNNAAVTGGMSIGLFVAASVDGSGEGFLFLNEGMSMGSAVLQFTVTLPTTGYRAFSGQTNNYGAIRLTSNYDSPISIDLGQDHNVGGHGLLELNVGAADFDNIAPSLGNSVVVSGLSIASADAAIAATSVLEAAITQIGQQRASLGAIENRLDHTVSNLANIVENTEAAKSRILDADFAYESAQLARAQILQQAGTAMLAQANAAPQNVLSLLG